MRMLKTRSIRNLGFIFRYQRYVPSLQQNIFQFFASCLQHYPTGIRFYISDLVLQLAFELRNDPMMYEAWYMQHNLRLEQCAKRIDSTNFTVPAIVIYLDLSQPEALANLSATVNSLEQQILHVDQLLIQLCNIPPETNLKLVQDSIPATQIKSRCSIYDEPGGCWADCSTSEYVLFTIAGVKFHSSATVFFTRSLAENPDLVYSDHGLAHPQTKQLAAIHFKPDYSANLLCSTDYIGHTFVCSRRILQAFDKSSLPTYCDMQLAVRRHPEKAIHIAKVLYMGGDSALDPGVPDSIRKSIKESIDRGSPQVGFELHPVETINSFMTHYRNMGAQQSVTIVIPTKDRVDLLEKCIDSIHKAPTDVLFDICIVDNQSSELATKQWLDEIQKQYEHVHVIKADYQFNWARLNNGAICQSEADVLVFLNNDIEIVSDNWLEQTCGQLMRKEVGLIGGLLKYPDGTIQHAGTVTGVGGKADHIHRFLKPEDIPLACICNPLYQREVTAVTGAFMAITRSNFNRIGPFNEDFKVCGSDIEYCLRVRQSGLLILFDPSLEMVHHESMTRAPKAPEGDIQLLMKAIQHHGVEDDPFYNKNLSKLSSYATLDIT